MADGREFRSKTVLNTFERPLDPQAAAGLSLLEPLRSIPPSISHLSLYVGLKHPDGAPDFGCTNLWIYNDADHDASVARFAADSAGPFPALFISFPSAKDPTFHQRHPTDPQSKW